MEELLGSIAHDYGPFDDRKNKVHDPSLNAMAAKYNLNVLKVRKLLITAGAYSTVTSRGIAKLAKEGLTVKEISDKTGLSRASVGSPLNVAHDIV